MSITSRELNLQLPVPISVSGNNSNRSKLHAVLVESSSYASDNRAATLMNAFTEKARNMGICVSGVVSQSLDQTEVMHLNYNIATSYKIQVEMLFK